MQILILFFFNLDLSIANCIVLQNMLDKRENFNFEIVDFHLLAGDVTSHALLMVYIFHSLFSF